MFFVCGFKIWFSLLYDTQIYMRAHTFFLVFFYLVNSVEKKANNFKLFSKNIDLRMQRITLKTCRTFSKHVLQCFCSQEQKKRFWKHLPNRPYNFCKVENKSTVHVLHCAKTRFIWRLLLSLFKVSSVEFYN